MKTKLVVCLLVVFSSCKKSDIQADFHGRITYECDGSPVKGLKVYVKWVGIHNEDTYVIQEAWTDVNGYYSFSTKVKRPGAFDGYRLITTSSITPQPEYFIGNGYDKSHSADEDAKDIQIDMAIPSNGYIRFHLKNVIPVNADDNFNYLNQVYPNRLLIGGHSGESIDETYLCTITGTDTFRYQYKFTKNGIENIVDDTLIGVCHDTTLADIFY